MPFFPYAAEAVDHLRRKDRKLGAAIDRIGPIQREINPDLFEALVDSIISQQISGKAALTIWNRLEALVGGITPAHILAADPDAMQKCGLSHRKVGYIRGAAQAVATGALDLQALPAMGDGEIIAALSALGGIGVWTAEMLLIFSLCRPDVVSFGDLAIRRGMMRLYGLRTLTKEQFGRYRKRYAPYGTVASLYLWALSVE